MSGVARRFAHEYGARPLHLILVLASFFLTGYAIARMMDAGGWQGWLLLIVGAAVLHDVVFLPLYTAVALFAGKAAEPIQPRARMLATLNHVRLPAVVSGVLFTIWFPLITGLGSAQYERKTGLPSDVYLEHWLLISGVLFLISGVVYAARVARRPRGAGSAGRQPR